MTRPPRSTPDAARTGPRPKSGSKPREGEAKDAGEGVRLQKVLASAGIASRRAAEDLIRRGRVTVGGKRAILGQRVDPYKDLIEIDGARIPSNPGKVYVMLNKPPEVISTSRDTRGRKTVLDLVDLPLRLFSVGRLDAGTEGLLILTNDGDLTHRLTHPSFGVQKVYVAEVDGSLRLEDARRLRETGVDVGEGPRARAVRVRILSKARGRQPKTLVEVTVDEGRKHVVRLMLERSGFPVRRLVRNAIGPLKLGRLPSGRHRKLTASEVASLYRAVKGAKPPSAPEKR